MWEYYTCKIVSPGEDLEAHNEAMARLGLDGWELCGAYFSPQPQWLKDEYRMFFKRPKQPIPVSDGSVYR